MFDNIHTPSQRVPTEYIFYVTILYVIVLFWCENAIGDMFILIIHPLRLIWFISTEIVKQNARKSWSPKTTMGIPFIRYFDDVIITSRRETQMGDQVIFISYPLKFDLV